MSAVQKQLLPATTSHKGWQSPASVEMVRQPGSTAVVVAPDRAIAGEFLTSTVMNADGVGEPSVELSFNGAPLPTDKKGQALYMVAEGSPPGRSLNIALSSRPDLSPTVVEILQPLTAPLRKEPPRLDSITARVGSNRMAVVEGHNFDGVGEHDHVVVDGMYEGRVVAASPVQLKVHVPEATQPGHHTIVVSGATGRSNDIPFQFVDARMENDPREVSKDEMTRVIVRVVGTNDKVQVHLTNLSPEAIKFDKGTDFRITSPGGADNMVVLGVQRLRRPPYRIQTIVE
ncbi:MAG: hypothetical protein ACRD3W_32220 [Terriglobales bacterium]